MSLFTIGHSNHDWPRFLELLRQHEITAIGDVRSAPYSAYNPQYNRESLAELLRREKIAYVHLGRELGARREEPECYDPTGRVQFDRVLESPLFQSGLQRVREGLRRFRIALMCAEKDPLECHRCLLISRAVRREFPKLAHIREQGRLEAQSDLETRLIHHCDLPTRDLFRTREELVHDAFQHLSGEVAFRLSEASP